MSEHVPVERALGNLDARMTAMEARMTAWENRIDSRLNRIEASLEEVHAAVISARGAWRAVAWIASVAGLAAGAVTAVIHWFAPRP